jgi:molecular chaperone HtpG
MYTQDPEAHDALIKSAKNRGYDVLKMDTVLDNHWMQHIEYRSSLDLLFVRIDSDTLDKLVQKDEQTASVLSEQEIETVKGVFEKTVGNTTAGGRVECSALAPDDLPVTITRPEFLRRMKDMQALHGMGGSDFLDSYNVVVNTNHPLVAEKLVKAENAEAQSSLAQYLYEVALLQQGMLRGEALTKFVEKTLGKL